MINSNGLNKRYFRLVRMLDEQQKVGAVIVAAGASERMGGVDKVMAPLAGRPALAWVIDAFQNCEAVDQIVVVLNERNLEQANQLASLESWSKVTDFCTGGRRRQDSVLAGLGRLRHCHWVIIHDGARPLVTADLIDRGLEMAKEAGAAVAAIPVTDTIKMAGSDHMVQQTPSRNTLWSVQTPQIFRFTILADSYLEAGGEVTDDATLVEQKGYWVKLYMSSYDNIKITTPTDLALAEILLKKRGV
jgi:2-C-methyl-D-erythritol 4-phosphate cytidylyltransferase